jgi:hypothetical protein
VRSSHFPGLVRHTSLSHSQLIPPYPPHFLVCAVMGLYDGWWTSVTFLLCSACHNAYLQGTMDKGTGGGGVPNVSWKWFLAKCRSLFWGVFAIVEALQFSHHCTQSHWSSWSTICFPSRGSAVHVPGMHPLSQGNRFLLLVLSRYSADPDVIPDHRLR